MFDLSTSHRALGLAALIGSVIGSKTGTCTAQPAGSARWGCRACPQRSLSPWTLPHRPGPDSSALSRHAKAVLTGIGFLGAGVIIHDGAAAC